MAKVGLSSRDPHRRCGDENSTPQVPSQLAIPTRVFGDAFWVAKSAIARGPSAGANTSTCGVTAKVGLLVEAPAPYHQGHAGNP
jgi:hypothetical protein